MSLTFDEIHNNFINDYLGVKCLFDINNLLHNSNGPACVFTDVIQWYKHGKFHRVDGPAVIHRNGTEEWWFEGQLHRAGGPAIKYGYGTHVWYRDGLIHREDGPAYIHSDGTEEWVIHRQLHREDGPAIKFNNGYNKWALDDIVYTFDMWLDLTPISNERKLMLKLEYA